MISRDPLDDTEAIEADHRQVPGRRPSAGANLRPAVSERIARISVSGGGRVGVLACALRSSARGAGSARRSAAWSTGVAEVRGASGFERTTANGCGTGQGSDASSAAIKTRTQQADVVQVITRRWSYDLRCNVACRLSLNRPGNGDDYARAWR